ncbi:MAG: hypothetical protein A2041_14040 [Bacteroidetes bacterium GWA2_31_9b]|nr:MAG: hypothetical protein A2041_14040 [Bacteroidetes bacterium GWA2_31_9b]
MKRFFLILLITTISMGILNAQQKTATISFEKESHNFGTFKEDQGTVEHKFIFTNTGQSPLVINNVKASCGCTSPSWTEKPVMPGEKGFVNAIYDPKNRPGAFNKTITVESNATNSRIVLKILGEVIAREKTVEDIYPKSIGELRLETTHFSFVQVYTNAIKKDTLKILNSSKTEMKITFEDVPSYLKLKVVPTVLKSGEKGYIIGEYNGAQVNDWDFVTDRVKLLTNGQIVNNGALTISANVQEDFSNLSADQLKNAPSIQFEKADHDFGKIKGTENVEHLFKFKNVGKSDLIIRKIKASCGCTTVEPEKTTLKPGESSMFKTIFKPGGRKGVQRKSINVITNDPNNPNVRLMISADIIE